MGQVMKVQLSCYLVLAKPGNKAATPSWPDPDTVWSCYCVVHYNTILFTALQWQKVEHKLDFEFKKTTHVSSSKGTLGCPVASMLVCWVFWCAGENVLTHWGRVTHICVGNLNIIGSDNGLSPGRRQAIILNSAGILLIGPLGTNFSEILTRVQIFSFKKMHLKMASAKWRPFCPSLNVSSYSGTALHSSNPHLLHSWRSLISPC